MNSDEASFIIYIIHKVARRNGVTPSQVYSALNKTECISKYLVPCYDVLHTMSADTVAEDVLFWVKNHGEQI
ncbi:MAG: DUF3791 domain-containing protein [Campylobacter sp.]|uniref:DUF3791 domain-containing protein n=1 Tax=Campylobacter sp. TaxID=205 RepID=UPI001B6A2A11|nr:DUF3791 domain-containing protein [Campylobacter sp.]MBP3674913.1 DUF3791 domain-containing protein [Campylobacter sp.]